VSPPAAGVCPGARQIEPLGCDPSYSAVQENEVTVLLRCLNCGFSFVVTYPANRPIHDSTMPVACGHCRSTQWSSQAT
jgi:ribosomal protein S27AE